MKSEIEITEGNLNNEYFPALFANKDKSIIILAIEKISKSTFSGTIIYLSNDKSKNTIGTFSDGWTYTQFKRMTEGTSINIKLTQER